MKETERTNDSVSHFVVEFESYYIHILFVRRYQSGSTSAFPFQGCMHIYAESRNLSQTLSCPYCLTCSVRRWADLS